MPSSHERGAPRADAGKTQRAGGPVVVIMGVSGVGKTTVGRALAQRLGWPFRDADAFHPPANVEKMRRGEPLDDADRAPWLDALHRAMADHLERGEPAVFTCSALKRAYRDRLARPPASNLFWVHLKGEPDLIEARLRSRRGHFMNAGLLRSQFGALEEPGDALTLDVSEPPEHLAETIAAQLPMPGAPRRAERGET